MHSMVVAPQDIVQIRENVGLSKGWITEVPFLVYTFVTSQTDLVMV